MPKAKQNVTFQNPDDVHVIKLKKRRFPWWLIFLLLPLLLLVKCNKEITFQVVKQINNSPVDSAEVHFAYTERVLFKNTLQNFSGYTNSEGKVSFKTKYSLYAYFLNNNDSCTTNVFAQCLEADTAKHRYHKLKKKKITQISLAYIRNDIGFLVANRTDKQRIPNSTVTIKVENPDFTEEHTDTTDIAGMVYFKNIPSCSKITVTAGAYGYNDTLFTQESNSLIGKEEVIFLTPITRSITFWVKNLLDKNPLPGAIAEIILDGQKTGYKVTTNTNGAISVIGEGIFKNIHIIKKLQISVQKNSFYDTLSPIPEQLVEFFVKADSANRTILMRPKPSCLNFKIVNSITNQKIKGAKCVITTKRGKTYTEYSNVDGIVQICGFTYGEIVSVVASKTGYKSNSYTVNNKKIETISSPEVIPLKPLGPPPTPCDGGTNNTNPDKAKVGEQYYMGKTSGSFTFEYFTDSEADSMYIYEGNNLLWKFEGATNDETLKVNIEFHEPLLRIKVLHDSNWWYKVNPHYS